MNSYLVHLPTERKTSGVLQAALSLAKLANARLDAIAIGYENTGAGIAAIGGAAVAEVYEYERERAMGRAEAIASVMEAEARGAGIACRTIPISGVPFSAYETIGAAARLYDLTIVLQPEWATYSFDNQVAEVVLFNSGGPVLIVPYIHAGPLRIGHVGIAWDGSRAAARAVRDAAPFLQQATTVSLITVNDDAPPEASSSALKAQLASKGIHSRLVQLKAAASEIQPSLLSVAADECLDLMVMGGYGHSRIGERILGGVTRSMFDSMTIPTLMSH